MRQILILIIFLLINTNSFADKRFEKKYPRSKEIINYLNKIY